MVSGSSSGSTTGAAQPYTLVPFQSVRISSHSDQPNFQTAVATIDLHDGPYASATMLVDLESPCFPFSKWQTDPPPSKQNWPADCDAYDRNLEFSIDDPGPDGGPPGLEIRRAITPFGGPLVLGAQITDVANGLAQGPHQLKVVIPTYSDGAGKVSGSNGSWNVTATLVLTPGTPPRRVLAVEPLYYGAMRYQTASQQATVTVPAGTTFGWIEYRVTGHGGDADTSGSCIGPAEEFCQRQHTLTLDGQPLAQLTPWRTDCACHEISGGPFGQYCDGDPCGAPSSVAAPRANWCPGSGTAPFVFDAGALAQPGQHTLSWRVDGMVDGGGGIWETSVTYIAIGQ